MSFVIVSRRGYSYYLDASSPAASGETDTTDHPAENKPGTIHDRAEHDAGAGSTRQDNFAVNDHTHEYGKQRWLQLVRRQQRWLEWRRIRRLFRGQSERLRLGSIRPGVGSGRIVLTLQRHE